MSVGFVGGAAVKERTVCADWWDLSAGAGGGASAAGGGTPREQPVGCRYDYATGSRDSFGLPRLGGHRRGGMPLRRGVSHQEQTAAQAVLVGQEPQPCRSRYGGQGRLHGQGRGRLSGLPFNVTVVIKLEAVLWGNVPRATGGAVVVNLADPSVGPGTIAARAFVVIEEHWKPPDGPSTNAEGRVPVDEGQSKLRQWPMPRFARRSFRMRAVE